MITRIRGGLRGERTAASEAGRKACAPALARAARAAVICLVAALVVLPGAPATAQEVPGDAPQQVIDPNQAQGEGRVVLDDGHIDYGPTLNTGRWIIQIHDDTAQPSYWRMLDDVVARVNDTSKLTAPSDPAYAFLGLEPGVEVWVIPQVRAPGVVWAGWNTQEPTVLDSLKLGVTQRVLGVDGPGEVTVYLQSGNFGEPQVLWSTLDVFPQESWIEANTHTHANWVFDEPGVYLVELEFEGDLVDGSRAIARDTLRFAVGDATDPLTAFDREFDESLLTVSPAAPGSAEAVGAGGDPASGGAHASGSEGGAGVAELAAVVGAVVALGLLAALIVIVMAGRRAKAQSREGRNA